MEWPWDGEIRKLLNRETLTEKLYDEENGMDNAYKFLEVAVRRSFDELLHLILDVKKIDLNQKLKDGTTLLHTAIHFGYLGIIKILINNGADVNAEIDGEPLLFKIFKSNTFRNKGNVTFSPQPHSSDASFEDIFEELLKKGADPRIKLSSGMTYLVFAINQIGEEYTMHNEIIELLLQYGCDPNEISGTKTNYSRPITVAAQFNNSQIIKSLIEYGADINGLDSQNWSALCVATDFNHTLSIILLLELGADVHIQHFNKCFRISQTLLHEVASSFEYKGKLLEQFLNCGCDINEPRASDKKTAFMCAEKESFGVDPKYVNWANLNVLLKHIVKMKICRLYVNEGDMNLILNKKQLNTTFNTLFVKYSRGHEIETMKKVVIYENITLYHIISKSVKEIAPYLKNEAVRKYLRSISNTRFPMFKACIELKYHQALKLRYLLDVAEKTLLYCLNSYFNNVNIPTTFIDRVMEFLDVEDLTTLRKLNIAPEITCSLSEQELARIKLINISE